MKKHLRSHIIPILIAFLLVNLLPLKSMAQAESTTTPTTPEIDDSFDPFSDYNEFEQETEEEADINFLRNGRYLSLALVTGYRGFTDGFAEAYTGGLTYGAQFSYFFDLNLSAALGYTTGDYNVFFQSFGPGFSLPTTDYSGSINLQIFDLQVKYYFNTDNVTKGLADLNPYALFGTAFISRTYSLSSNAPDDPDQVVGFRLGSGIEIPLLQRRFYLGLQAIYTYVQFPDENKPSIDEGPPGQPSTRDISPSLDGDTYELNVILGTNF